MQQLRESGIYQLGRAGEFVVHAVFRGGYILFAPEVWEYGGPHRYEVRVGGEIFLAGRATAHRIDDLGDTGRTARSRSGSGAALCARPN